MKILKRLSLQFGMTIVGASCLVLASPEVLAACIDPPGNDQVTVWTGLGFSGSCTTLGHGLWNVLPAGFDNNIESMKVGSLVRLIGYREANRSGDYTIWESGSYCSTCSMKLGAVGTATNNSLSSAFVAWAGPHRMSYTFLSDFPSNRETWWTENMQGLCHTNDSWIFAYRGSKARPRAGPVPPAPGKYVVVKIPFWQSLSRSTTATARFELPYGNNESGGLDHIGDPDCDDEFVFLAAEDTEREGQARPRTTLPHIIVLRSSNLAEVTRFPLFGNGQGMEASWVAIKGKNQFGDYTLVSSPLTITNGVGIKFYGWSPVGLNAWNEGDGPVLLDDHGAPLTRPNMAGGDYSPDQQALYISVGKQGSTSEYVYAFDPNGSQYGRSSRSGDWWGPFPYVSGDHEGEGIDFFEVAGKNIPGVPSGQLHVVLLNPDVLQDNVWIKHYDNRWQFATP